MQMAIVVDKIVYISMRLKVLFEPHATLRFFPINQNKPISYSFLLFDFHGRNMYFMWNWNAYSKWNLLCTLDEEAKESEKKTHSANGKLIAMAASTAEITVFSEFFKRIFPSLHVPLFCFRSQPNFAEHHHISRDFRYRSAFNPLRWWHGFGIASSAIGQFVYTKSICETDHVLNCIL